MIRVKDLTAEQRQVLAVIRSEGRRAGAGPRAMKAAVETGLVESGLRNLDHGDADSEGWRQERRSLYKDPRNLRASVRRFFEEAKKLDTGRGTAGQLAARVQRPAAQYRGRYHERSADAEALLGMGARPTAGGERPTPSASASGGGLDAAVVDPGLRLNAALALREGRSDALDQLAMLKAAEAAAGEMSAGAERPGRTPERAEVKQRSRAKLSAGGGWGGTEHLFRPLDKLAAKHGVKRGGGKRTPQQNAAVGGSETSDHLTTNKSAFADDYSGKDMLGYAKSVAKHFGVPFKEDSYESGGVVEVGGRKFKVQILYGRGNKIHHADHVHVGVRAL